MKCRNRLEFYSGALFALCTETEGHDGWHGNDALVKVTWKVDDQGVATDVRFDGRDYSKPHEIVER